MTSWRDPVRLASRSSQPGTLQERQWVWLQRCLQRNSIAEYGRQHQFAEIDSAASYQQHVPIQSYAQFASAIDRMARGATDVLFAGKPIAFERTGGSSGGSKLIPYSVHSLQDFQMALLPWLCRIIYAYQIERRTAYWAISPATRQPELTLGGIPIGLSDSAYLGDRALQAFSKVSALPVSVGSIDNIPDWQLATLYWLVRRYDLALVSVWSPTFFLQLLRGLDERRDELLAVLAQGGSVASLPLSPDLAAARHLISYYRDGDTRCLWPDIRLISCWVDASSRGFANELQARFPDIPIQGKGLLATEGVMTVPDKTGRTVLSADSGFYEFQDETGQVYNAWELREGDCRDLILTTAGGLYRYQIGDRVRCEGFAGDVPILSFLGRSGLVSDMVGEKLTEEFVADCLHGLPGFRMLVPVLQGERHYKLVVECRHADRARSMLPTVKLKLARNPQYAYARRLRQLGEVKMVAQDAPLAMYMTYLAQHQRLGDIKVPALCPQDANLVRRMVGGT